MKFLLVFLLALIAGVARADLPTGALRVRVTDAATGAPLSGADVSLAAGPALVTGADGAVRFAGLVVQGPYRAVTVSVHADGYDDAVWKDAEVFPADDTILPFRLTRTGRAQVFQDPPHALSQPGPGMNAAGPFGALPPDGGGGMSGLGPMPAYIRVWRKAKSDAAGRTIVENIPFEEYVKGVVPREWYASWDAESLKAGCVAARTYGLYKTRYPRYPDIGADVSDTTATQVYGDARSSSTNAAADATRAQVLTYNGAPINAEYSAENSDPTTAGPFPYQPSVSDPVCAGQPLNGHGRGLCQWGSQRWATGASGSGGRKTYTWILDHYYGPAATLEVAGGGLAVGDCAMVQGGQASVRAAPNGAFLTSIPTGTQVHLVEGPTVIGISRWWRIAWPLPQPTRADGWVTEAYLVEIACPTMSMSIANLRATDITDSGATIRWDTLVEASSVLRVGGSPDTLLPTTAGEPGTEHAVLLTGLRPLRTYYYQAQSTAPGFSTATSEVLNFTTPAPPGDFNGDGTVTLSDAMDALNVAAGSTVGDAESVARADVFGGDGQVTLEDVLVILRRALEVEG